MGVYVAHDHPSLVYMGRTELYEGFPRFVFPCTSVTLRFTGKEIGCVIQNHKFYNTMEVGVVIDGRPTKVTFEHEDRDIRITLAEGLDDEPHKLTLFKCQAASHYFEFKGFELDDGAQPLEPDPLPDRRIECYGDSVSAGEVSEAVGYTASKDPENTNGIYDNAWYAYPWITARNLGAQLHDIAQGGIAVFDKTGYYHAPDYIGMESTYDKTCYIPEAEGGCTPWDFSRYIPHIVLFAVGQNDPHGIDDIEYDITDPEYREKWKSAYKAIIKDLRGKYPKAVFILLLTVLMHSPDWDMAVEEIARELDDPRVKHFMFTRTGKATPGHPRITEQYEMAEELTAFISGMGDDVWK